MIRTDLILFRRPLKPAVEKMHSDLLKSIIPCSIEHCLEGMDVWEPVAKARTGAGLSLASVKSPDTGPSLKSPGHELAYWRAKQEFHRNQALSPNTPSSKRQFHISAHNEARNMVSHRESQGIVDTPQHHDDWAHHYATNREKYAGSKTANSVARIQAHRPYQSSMGAEAKTPSLRSFSPEQREHIESGAQAVLRRMAPKPKAQKFGFGGVPSPHVEKPSKKVSPFADTAAQTPFGVAAVAKAASASLFDELLKAGRG